MHSHKHDHCEHELKYCEKCDVVYCKKCDREWGKQNIWWYYPNYYPYTYPTYTTCGSSTSTDTVTYKCDHTG